jgi:hypothetical protein
VGTLLFGLILAMLMLAPLAAWATSGGTTIDVSDNSSPAGIGWTYANGIYTVTGPQGVTIQGATIANRVVVSSGANVNITLNGANIYRSGDASGTRTACAFDMTGATVHLTFGGDASINALLSGTGCAGLLVPAGSTLTIDGGAANFLYAGSADNPGSIVGSAGIGGGAGNNDSGTIIIKGGSVRASAGITFDPTRGGAGIGGGSRGASGDILIYGEATQVLARRGGSRARDIGTGSDGAGGHVFVALPQGRLFNAAGEDTGNPVLFTATLASAGTVAATLPAPFNAMPFNTPIDLLTRLTTTGKTLSVITTFTTDSVAFTLPGYGALSGTGKQLKALGAMFPFQASAATVIADATLAIVALTIVGLAGLALTTMRRKRTLLCSVALCSVALCSAVLIGFFATLPAHAQATINGGQTVTVPGDHSSAWNAGIGYGDMTI